MAIEDEQFYLCEQCLTPDDSPGACHVCGGRRLECRPGDPDDPCRRPLMDRMGRIQTRAPRWWLRHRVKTLMEYIEEVENRG